MTLHWMLYASALSLCFGLAALALERAARVWTWPRRFVWAAAIAASLVVPAAVLTIPSVPAPRPAATGSVLFGDLVVRGSSAAGAPSVPAPGTLEQVGHLIAALNRPLLVLWAGASLALALGLLRAGVGLRRRARGWRAAVVDGSEVLVAPDIGPAVVRLDGLWIVLPEWALGAEPAARTLMLLHENEHRRARDPDLLLGATVAVVLVPWALPLWWQLRRLQLAVETDCDRRVMRAGADAHAYGVLLLSVGAHSIRQPLLVPTAFSEARSLLERRIEAMTSPTSKRRLVRTALATAVSALGVAAACVTPRPAAPAPQAAPAAAPPTAPTPAQPAAAAVQQPRPTRAAREAPDSIYREQDVAQRPERIGGPAPRYPDSLRTAGVSGRVLVSFIVDTAGHVEPGSVVIDSSTNPAFDAPTREAVLASTFRPGQVRGRAVRVQVTMPVNFQVARSPDATQRIVPSDSVLSNAVKALQAQDYPRADSLFGEAQQQASRRAQTAMFYRGVAEFQRGYAALQDAQSKARDAEGDPAAKAAACTSAKAAGDFLSQAESNIKGGAAANQELASQMLTHLPELKNAVPGLARALNCPQ